MNETRTKEGRTCANISRTRERESLIRQFARKAASWRDRPGVGFDTRWIIPRAFRVADPFHPRLALPPWREVRDRISREVATYFLNQRSRTALASRRRVDPAGMRWQVVNGARVVRCF